MNSNRLEVIISGGGGLIGTALREHFTEWNFRILDRSKLWGDPGALAAALDGGDMLINLAGAPIAKRWTRRYKEEIVRSREELSQRLVRALEEAGKSSSRTPGIFLNASAIGIYAQKGKHDEYENTPGEGFLREVVEAWERPMKELPEGVQGVRLRIGNVLDRRGGVMAPFLLSARFGVIPVMGRGDQSFSFIHMEDLLRALEHIVHKRRSEGPEEGVVYNLCSPHPVDMATFVKVLAGRKGSLIRPRIPAGLIRAGLGEAHVLLTEGAEVYPARLIKEGFDFRYPRIEQALENIVKKP
jgi:hypothetical protein